MTNKELSQLLSVYRGLDFLIFPLIHFPCFVIFLFKLTSGHSQADGSLLLCFVQPVANRRFVTRRHTPAHNSTQLHDTHEHTRRGRKKSKW